MKSIIFLVFMFFSFIGFSQNPPLGSPVAIPNQLDGNLFNFYALNNARVDYARILVPFKEKEIEGNVYAFKDWKNRGVIYLEDENFKLSNVNFNMRVNRIEAKVDNDSIYIFDLTNVDHMYINNRKFKNYYFSNQNEILEVVYDGNNFKMLKDYKVDVKRGDVDPLMVKKQVAKFYTNTFYYIKKGNDFSDIKLKKKDILLLFNDKSSLVNNFAKENKLSYKSEKDLNKIFSYYESL